MLISKEDLFQQYVIDGKSQAKIASKIGCNRVTILNYLRRYGIQSRQKNGKYQEPFTVKRDYFEKWSPEMAYMLGYVVADGGLRPSRYELKLKSIDYEILEWCNQQFKSNYPITEEKNTNCYILYIYSKEIIQSLEKLGVHARKSLTVELPKIPKEFFWDYLRGNVDGDGYVGIPKRSQIKFGLTSNFVYLSQILKVLNERIGCPLYAINPQGRAGQIAINGKHAYRCLKEMYDNERFALSRKRARAFHAIREYERYNGIQ